MSELYTSFTDIKHFLSCQRVWKFRDDGKKFDDKSDLLVLGTEAHEIFARVLELFYSQSEQTKEEFNLRVGGWFDEDGFIVERLNTLEENLEDLAIDDAISIIMRGLLGLEPWLYEPAFIPTEGLSIEFPLSWYFYVPEGRISIRGKADALLKEKATGAYILVDHKFKKNISEERDLPSMQFVIYKEAIRQMFGINLHALLYYEVKATAPKLPKITKDGKVSRANIVTTWEWYKSVIEITGEDPKDYDDMRVKLEARSWQEKRWVYQSPTLTENIIENIKEICSQMLRIHRGMQKPLKVLSQHHPCVRCSYYTWCVGETRGDDMQAVEANIDFIEDDEPFRVESTTDDDLEIIIKGLEK